MAASTIQRATTMLKCLRSLQLAPDGKVALISSTIISAAKPLIAIHMGIKMPSGSRQMGIIGSTSQPSKWAQVVTDEIPTRHIPARNDNFLIGPAPIRRLCAIIKLTGEV
jgi:hypothetical protein